MDKRQLRTLLNSLSAAGVTMYRDADVELHFADRLPTVPERDVDGNTDDLSLPLGVADPRAAINRLYEKHGKKARS